MGDKVKPWHGRKPKRHGDSFKSQRPDNRGKKSPKSVDFNDDDFNLDEELRIAAQLTDPWET